MSVDEFGSGDELEDFKSDEEGERSRTDLIDPSLLEAAASKPTAKPEFFVKRSKKREMFTRQSSTRDAFTRLQSLDISKSKHCALYAMSAEKSLSVEELEEREFKEKLARAPSTRLLSASDSRTYDGVRHTKSEVILTRVWKLLKASKAEAALWTLMEFLGEYRMADCVPGAGDSLPLWALMPSRLSRADALASLPVWRYILKKFSVASLRHTDIHGVAMTPMSVSASFDLDDFVRAVVAEEQLQGCVSEEVAFAEKCEVLQHNCILMIEAMRAAANNEAAAERRKVRTSEVVLESLRKEAGDALDADALQRVATAVSQKLKEDSDKQLLESAFALMRDALISLTKEKRCVLKEVWTLCWEWQKLAGEKSLWLTVKQKLKDVFDFSRLSQRPTDWHWYLQNWAENPLMAELSAVGEMDAGIRASLASPPEMLAMASASPMPATAPTPTAALDSVALMRTKYDDVCEMCQVSEVRRQIECEMGALIAASEDAWAAVGAFTCVNAAFASASSWRQDCVEHGVVAKMEESDLFHISLHTSALDFDAAQSYDLDSYMTEVLTTAHYCNPKFQKFMEQAYAGVCHVHSGPVKGIERCRVKAQLEYSKSNFPTSARIIDLIRCSLTFEHIAGFYETLKELTLVADTTQIADASRRRRLRDALSKNGLKLEVLRCKNGFLFEGMREGVDFFERSAGGLPIPSVYGDVKLNVIVTSVSRKVAVIGEVQFLLSAMLKAKLASHEFYEVTRRQPFFQSVRKHLPVFTRNLKIAGSTQRQLTQLLVRQPLWFTKAVFTDTATDHANRNFVMRLVTTKGLKLDLAQYLLSLPTGVPAEVWLQKTEANMTLLKYVLALANCKLMALLLSTIPAHIQCEVWTLASPLILAMEMRDTIPLLILEAIPEAADIWNDAELIAAAIHNRHKKGLLARLRLLASHMSEKSYGAALRSALPSSKLKMTPLMAAIRHHGVDAQVVDYLIPFFEDTAEDRNEMIRYWTHTADNGWTVLAFATEYSDAAGMQVIKSYIPAEDLAKVMKLLTDIELKEMRKGMRLRDALTHEMDRSKMPQLKKMKARSTTRRKWQGTSKRRGFIGTQMMPYRRKKSDECKSPTLPPSVATSVALKAQDLVVNAFEASYGVPEFEAKSKPCGRKLKTVPSQRRVWIPLSSSLASSKSRDSLFFAD